MLLNSPSKIRGGGAPAPGALMHPPPVPCRSNTNALPCRAPPLNQEGESGLRIPTATGMRMSNLFLLSFLSSKKRSADAELEKVFLVVWEK